jgi:hypothetical protein
MHLPIPSSARTIRSHSYTAAAALGLALAVTAVLAPSAAASTPAAAFAAKASTYQNAEITAALSRAPGGVRVAPGQVEWNDYAVVLTVPTTAQASTLPTALPAATDSCPAPIIGYRWTCVYTQFYYEGRRLQFKDAGYFQDLRYYGGAAWMTMSWSNTRGQRTWLQQNASHTNAGHEICLTGNARAGILQDPNVHDRWIYLSTNYDRC